MAERTCTIFTDVQLLEVNQTGNGGGQVGQVIIRHAQLLQGLAVEELLWKHRGQIKECLQSAGKIPQTFGRNVQKDRERESPLEAHMA